MKNITFKIFLLSLGIVFSSFGCFEQGIEIDFWDVFKGLVERPLIKEEHAPVMKTVAGVYMSSYLLGKGLYKLAKYLLKGAFVSLGTEEEYKKTSEEAKFLINQKMVKFISFLIKLTSAITFCVSPSSLTGAETVGLIGLNFLAEKVIKESKRDHKAYKKKFVVPYLRN